MSRAFCACALLLALAACGGGGTDAAAAASPLRLAADAVTIRAGAIEASVHVRLDGAARTPAPVLLQCDVELPPALELASPALAPLRPLPTLDGDAVNGRFRIVCGDASTVTAPPLAAGPLFELRLRSKQPRVPGEHTVRLRAIRVTATDGATVAADAAVNIRVTVE